MATTNFYLKSTPAKKKLIYLFFHFDGKALKYSTKEKVEPKYWLKSSKRVSSKLHGHDDINFFLIELEQQVMTHYRELRTKGIKPTTQILRTFLNNFTNKANTSDLQGFHGYYAQFVNDASKTLSERTIQKYRTLGKQLIEFEKKKRYKLDFDSINEAFYEKFLDYYFDDLQFLNNTVEKYVSNLKTFLNWAADKGYNIHTDYKKFKAEKEKKDIIFLTLKELEKIINLDIDNQNLEIIEQSGGGAAKLIEGKKKMKVTEKESLKRARDIFVLACTTGLRFSDIKKLKAIDIIKNQIVLTTEKTKTPVRIPLNSHSQSIIDRYKDNIYFLKVPANQTLNNQIKKIAYLAGFTDDITIKAFRGKKEIVRTMKKYQKVSMHMGRNTFIILSLEKGINHQVIMEWVGHKKYTTFMVYVKLVESFQQQEMKAWD